MIYLIIIMSSKGKTIVITGATGGIGINTAIGLAQKNNGANRIIITGRNAERGQAAVQRITKETGNSNVALVLTQDMDLSTAVGVQALAQALLKETNSVIDVLVNNVGYLSDELKHNDEGLEMHFAVNVALPWRLTMALLPALEKTSARVVNVTGGEETAGPIDVDNLQAEKGFAGLMTYGHSKSVSEAMSMALAQKLKSNNITVNVVFPGRASTAMTQESFTFQSLPGLMKLFYPLMWLMFRDDGGKSAAKAATSSIFAATNASLQGVTGKYYNSTAKEQSLHATAYDADIQAKVVEIIQRSSSTSSK